MESLPLFSTQHSIPFVVCTRNRHQRGRVDRQVPLAPSHVQTMLEDDVIIVDRLQTRSLSVPLLPLGTIDFRLRRAIKRYSIFGAIWL